MRPSPLWGYDRSRSDRRQNWNDPRPIRPPLRTRGALPGHDIDRAVGLHDRKPLALPGTDLQRVAVAETIQDGMLDTRPGPHRQHLDPGPDEKAAHDRRPAGRRGWRNY